MILSGSLEEIFIILYSFTSLIIHTWIHQILNHHPGIHQILNHGLIMNAHESVIDFSYSKTFVNISYT